MVLLETQVAWHIKMSPLNSLLCFGAQMLITCSSAGQHLINSVHLDLLQGPTDFN